MERPQPGSRPALVMSGQPKTYQYKPLEDITAYELAHLVEFLLMLMQGGDPDGAYARVPEDAKRHIKILE